eukprot:Hpha_TRINITY_DN16141_c2_g1::TRINITY_DN16141_c2_g1_i3::g.6019::m.6019
MEEEKARWQSGEEKKREVERLKNQLEGLMARCQANDGGGEGKAGKAAASQPTSGQTHWEWKRPEAKTWDEPVAAVAVASPPPSDASGDSAQARLERERKLEQLNRQLSGLLAQKREIELLKQQQQQQQRSKAAERRVDPSDGKAYTAAEFQQYYGGLSEWEAATPPSPAGAAHEAPRQPSPPLAASAPASKAPASEVPPPPESGEAQWACSVCRTVKSSIKGKHLAGRTSVRSACPKCGGATKEFRPI